MSQDKDKKKSSTQDGKDQVDGWLQWGVNDKKKESVGGKPPTSSAEANRSLIAELSMSDLEVMEEEEGSPKKESIPPPVPGGEKPSEQPKSKDTADSTLKGVAVPKTTTDGPPPPPEQAAPPSSASPQPSAAPPPPPSSSPGQPTGAPSPPKSSSGQPSGAPSPPKSSSDEASVMPPPPPSSSGKSGAPPPPPSSAGKSGAPPPPIPSSEASPQKPPAPPPKKAAQTMSELPSLPPTLNRKRDPDATPQPPSPPPPPPKLQLDDVPERVSTLEEDAPKLAELIRKELARDPDDDRAARLHHELGTLYEYQLDDLTKAAEQYRAALKKESEYLPSIRGARRTLLALDRPREALPLFDTEVSLTGDPKQRASLLLKKGSVFEHSLKMLPEAREVYRSALDLEVNNVSILKAMERCDRKREAWQDLASTYELLSNAVEEDDSYRAALIAERALLAEVRQRDRESASNLYGMALSLDPRAPGALPALKRLSYTSNQWNELITVLRHDLDLSTTSETRVADLRRIARVFKEKLGDTAEAVAALEAAAAESEVDVAILRDLVDLYTTSQRHDALASALERLFKASTDRGERLLLAHQLGQLFETSLKDDDSSRAWYEAALDEDQSFRPVLDALSNLYERSGEWDALMGMHLREIESSDDDGAKARAHAHIAQILESHLDRPDEATEHYDKALGFDLDHEVSFHSLTKLYAQAGRWRELAELYQRVVDSSPGEERAIAFLFKIGALYEDHLDDPAGALHAFQRILEIAPDHLGAIQAAQHAAERAGKHDTLLQMLEREVKIETRGKVKLSLLCRAAEVCALHLNDIDGAIQRFRRVLKNDSRHATALTSLSRLLRRAGRWEELLKNYQAELQQRSLGTKRVELIYKMGELCETHMGREKEAIAHYKQALAVEPTHRLSYGALVRALTSRKDYGELAKLMEERLESLDVPAEMADLAVSIGHMYEEHLENPALALASYARSLEARPGYQPALDGRRRLLHGAGKWKQLADDLAKDADTSTEESRALDAKVEEGLIRAHRLGDRSAAVTCFEWVLERSPDHCGALMALEELHVLSDDVAGLVEAYRRQADMITDAGARVAVLRELARLHEANDHRDDAVGVYQRVLELEERDGDALEALVAITSGREEPEEAIRALSQLVTSVDDTALNAAHMGHLAMLAESQNRSDVLGAYRAALALDPNSLVTTRGFTRAAQRSGDPSALHEAALREARTTRHIPTAVMLLETSAKLRIKEQDLDGAANDLEKALELDPQHAGTANALKAVLIRLSQEERLIEQLSRAADLATNSERKTELYLCVAELYSNHLHKLPAAIAAAQRALTVNPNHLDSLIRLARDLESSGRWNEAVETLGSIVDHASDDAVVVDAHLRLAAIVDDMLDQPERAASSLKVVLSKEPDNSVALFRMSRIEALRGNYDRALAHTQTLLDSSSSDADRAATLLQIAFTESKRKNFEAMGKALGEAVSIEGADGLSARYYEQMIESGTGDIGWETFLDMITKHIDRASTSGAPVGSSFRTAATILGDHLGRPSDAIKALRRGMDREPENIETRLNLARMLRQIGNHEQAVEEIRELFGRNSRVAEAWREYALVKQAVADTREASAATQALKLLEAATPEELVSVMAHQPRTTAAPEGFMDSPGLNVIVADHSLSPITELVAALEPAFSKLFPTDTGRYGLSKRDRIHMASVSPLRVVADDIARLLGVSGFDLYLHHQAMPDISIELGKPPALFIPEWAGSLPRQSLVFMLSRPLINIARGVHAVYRISIKELALLLAGATRQVVPSYQSDVGIEAEIEERARAVARAIPRRSRKAVAAAAERYARSKCDLKQWTVEVYRSADRAALLLSDDLTSAMEVMRRITGEPLEQNGEAAELLRFWASDTAVRFRRSLPS